MPDLLFDSITTARYARTGFLKTSLALNRKQVLVVLLTFDLVVRGSKEHVASLVALQRVFVHIGCQRTGMQQ